MGRQAPGRTTPTNHLPSLASSSCFQSGDLETVLPGPHAIVPDPTVLSDVSESCTTGNDPGHTLGRVTGSEPFVDQTQPQLTWTASRAWRWGEGVWEGLQGETKQPSKLLTWASSTVSGAMFNKQESARVCGVGGVAGSCHHGSEGFK